MRLDSGGGEAGKRGGGGGGASHVASARQGSPASPVQLVLGLGGSTPYSFTAIFFLKLLMEVMTLSDGLKVYCTII